jgi:thiamine biosynthesis protein ThiS
MGSMSEPQREPASGATISVNGAPWPWQPGLRLREVLRRLGAPDRGVAVERNRCVVRRADLDAVELAPGDEIEIVQLVGGG